MWKKFKTFRKIKYVPVNDIYIEQNKFGTKTWETMFETTLNCVKQKVISIMSASATATTNEPQFNRHCHALMGQKGLQKIKSHSFMKHNNEFDITYNFLEDLGIFICRKLCIRKAIFTYSGVFSDDFHDADNALIRKPMVLSVLKFKDKLLKRNSALSKYFHKNQHHCTNYFLEVLKIEAAVIFWTMSQFCLKGHGPLIVR